MTNYQKSPIIRRKEPDVFMAATGLHRLRIVKISHDYDAAYALFLYSSTAYRSELPHFSQTMASQIDPDPYHGHNNHVAYFDRHRRVLRTQ